VENRGKHLPVTSKHFLEMESWCLFDLPNCPALNAIAWILLTGGESRYIKCVAVVVHDCIENVLYQLDS
jgi:hypothetical protein